MSRTRRSYHDRMCLRKPRTHSQWAAQAEARELNKELADEFGVHLRNRDLTRSIANAWDDVCVAALSETKHLWKH